MHPEDRKRFLDFLRMEVRDGQAFRGDAYSPSRNEEQMEWNWIRMYGRPRHKPEEKWNRNHRYQLCNYRTEGDQAELIQARDKAERWWSSEKFSFTIWVMNCVCSPECHRRLFRFARRNGKAGRNVGSIFRLWRRQWPALQLISDILGPLPLKLYIWVYQRRCRREYVVRILSAPCKWKEKRLNWGLMVIFRNAALLVTVTVYTSGWSQFC